MGQRESVRRQAGSGPVGNREPVEIERRAKVGADCRLLGLQRDPGRIGDPVDGVEEADDTCRVGQSRRAQCRRERVARSCQPVILFAKQSFGKPDQQVTMRHAGVVVGNAGDRLEIVSPVVGRAARTEQQGMTGRSIETSVERRYPRRQELDLGVADRPSRP